MDRHDDTQHRGPTCSEVSVAMLCSMEAYSAMPELLVSKGHLQEEACLIYIWVLEICSTILISLAYAPHAPTGVHGQQYVHV